MDLVKQKEKCEISFARKFERKQTKTKNLLSKNAKTKKATKIFRKIVNETVCNLEKE